jgi:hypothetical protein
VRPGARLDQIDAAQKRGRATEVWPRLALARETPM